MTSACPIEFFKLQFDFRKSLSQYFGYIVILFGIVVTDCLWALKTLCPSNDEYVWRTTEYGCGDVKPTYMYTDSGRSF